MLVTKNQPETHQPLYKLTERNQCLWCLVNWDFFKLKFNTVGAGHFLLVFKTNAITSFPYNSPWLHKHRDTVHFNLGQGWLLLLPALC